MKKLIDTSLQNIIREIETDQIDEAIALTCGLYATILRSNNEYDMQADCYDLLCWLHEMDSQGKFNSGKAIYRVLDMINRLLDQN